MWPESFSLVCSLGSRVATSTRAYLLAMVNIAFDVLGFFMEILWIKDGSMSPFLKNIMIDLSSTARMIFPLLQKCWMNSRMDTPLFWMTLARSQLTPGGAHVVQKLLLNNRHKWLQE
jgi:hypothetical protein